MPTHPIGIYYLTRYLCPHCGAEWESIDDCQPDDDCGDCGLRHIEPLQSEEN